jgi:hypothetical protein
MNTANCESNYTYIAQIPTSPNCGAEQRPMLPPLPAMMQTFLERRPAMSVLLLSKRDCAVYGALGG